MQNNIILNFISSRFEINHFVAETTRKIIKSIVYSVSDHDQRGSEQTDLEIVAR